MPETTFEGLPQVCASTDLTTGKTILLKRGERGFWPGGEKFENLTADEINADLGVTKAQAEAMAAGSMFGWHVPAANPANYDEQGKFKAEFIKDIQQKAGVHNHVD
jgi:uncharacterized glyoxalase superfamily metalloenzyme YdcJ